MAVLSPKESISYDFLLQFGSIFKIISFILRAIITVLTAPSIWGVFSQPNIFIDSSALLHYIPLLHSLPFLVLGCPSHHPCYFPITAPKPNQTKTTKVLFSFFCFSYLQQGVVIISVACLQMQLSPSLPASLLGIIYCGGLHPSIPSQFYLRVLSNGFLSRLLLCFLWVGGMLGWRQGLSQKSSHVPLLNCLSVLINISVKVAYLFLMDQGCIDYGIPNALYCQHRALIWFPAAVEPVTWIRPSDAAGIKNINMDSQFTLVYVSLCTLILNILLVYTLHSQTVFISKALQFILLR